MTASDALTVAKTLTASENLAVTGTTTLTGAVTALSFFPITEVITYSYKSGEKTITSPYDKYNIIGLYYTNSESTALTLKLGTATNRTDLLNDKQLEVSKTQFTKVPLDSVISVENQPTIHLSFTTDPTTDGNLVLKLIVMAKD